MRGTGLSKIKVLYFITLCTSVNVEEYLIGTAGIIFSLSQSRWCVKVYGRELVKSRPGDSRRYSIIIYCNNKNDRPTKDNINFPLCLRGTKSGSIMIELRTGSHQRY